jgi:hypothetical protein
VERRNHLEVLPAVLRVGQQPHCTPNRRTPTRVTERGILSNAAVLAEESSQYPEANPVATERHDHPGCDLTSTRNLNLLGVVNSDKPQSGSFGSVVGSVRAVSGGG